MVWVGFDPGGKKAFGVAILADDGHVRSCTVSCADEAFELINSCPTAIGVDAPLWWSSGLSGKRKCDQWLRDEYGIASGTIQAANSLRGAALVQGAMIVANVRATYPTTRVTETHPKALLQAMRCESWKSIPVGYKVSADSNSEHEDDAIVSAIAAREGFEGRWTHDLSASRYESEQDPSAYWLGPVHYFWFE